MKQQVEFLTGRDRDDFERLGGCFIKRTVVQKPTRRKLDELGGATHLVTLLSERIQRKTLSVAAWFDCVCIAVTEGDGMSWSAQCVCEQFKERFAQFQRR